MSRAHGARANGAVVIVGASSGIGRATAHELAARGADLALASRSVTTLEVVAQECRSIAARSGFDLHVSVVRADVTDRSSIEALLEHAAGEHGRVAAIVNTVAVVAYGRFDEVPAEAFDRVVDVDFLGTANVVRAGLALFQEQRGGHLVVVGSLLGRIATPWMSTYVASKWAVHGLVRTVQIEARGMRGVDVSLVTPGAVDTPVYSQAGAYGGRTGRPPPPVSRPEAVARAIVRTLDRPRRTVSIGAANPLATAGFRLLPGVYDRIVRPAMHLGGLARGHVPPRPGNLWDPTPAGEAVHGSWGRHWLRPLGVIGVGALGLLVRRRLGRAS
ncbi:SDR family NAD(P)-dependent oxidoreductase [Cellulomonas rhizosphaerae]|uniref:SDR family NAD(P)-dependent oxidoreductase n=1 Tax=Cellulomonas rhizosphaerae TaxID=2293719 RepID=A0A413RQ33_9CELL|nr:SDR family NAD(P)-dependent oxidoreductase [Cellulomonas rhizosphaerae]RHA44099.1 SDR family NAD(P)-dependent oxidoreductase [Cellulomonas rhizosphaerae]